MTMGKPWLLLLFCAAVSSSFCQTQSVPSPVLRGTINVVLANDEGIVVLTDSMLTAMSVDEHGVKTEHQIAEPARKLFQIDDRTICTFAGFASAGTPSVPDFLNNSSAIIGRFEDRLKHFAPMPVVDKLRLLNIIFSYYLQGVANIRADGSKENYLIELLIAGYDPDGTPEMGRLIIEMDESAGAAGSVLYPVTRELQVKPIHGTQPPLFAGIEEVARRIADHPEANEWSGDPAIVDYAKAAKSRKSLTIEQMKALAVSLKQHTADKYAEVGGPTQIAVLAKGNVQSFKVPDGLPPVPVTGFKFEVVSGMKMTGHPEDPVKREATYGVGVWGCSAVYFNNSFTGVHQEIGEGFYSRNSFDKSLISYGGGPVNFGKSNQVTDSDLQIGPKVPKDSAEVKQLLNDFKWKSVEYQQVQTKSASPFYGFVYNCR